MAPTRATTKRDSAVLVWSNASTWIDDVAHCVRPHLEPEAMTIWQTKRRKLLQKYDDDPEWRTVLSGVAEQSYDQLKLKLTALLKQRAIRMHHCCRPVDPLVYRKEGLKRSGRSRRRAALSQTMDDLGLPSATRKEILAAVRQQQSVPDPELGTVFVAVDERDLTDQAGHYLLLGSEWIASRLGYAYYPALQGRGVPTLFQLDLPFSWMTQLTQLELADAFLREWTRLTALSSRSVRQLDFTAVLRRDVPPSMIVGHLHPSTIVDYHFGGVERFYPRMTCTLCRADS